MVFGGAVLCNSCTVHMKRNRASHVLGIARSKGPLVANRTAWTVLALSAFVVSACSSHRVPDPTEPAQLPARDASSDALGVAQQQAKPILAMVAVQELVRRGLFLPKPLDTTAHDCPAVGCSQSVVTDTLRILSFGTMQQAGNYASPRGLFWSQNLVVAFAPAVPAAERFRYMLAIGTLRQ